MTAIRFAALVAIFMPVAVAGCSRTAAPPASAATPSAVEILGSGPGISMARLVLGPGESRTIHAGPCQDVSVLVEKGAVKTSDDLRLASGRAARLSATTTLHAETEQGAELFAAAVLSEAASVNSVDWNATPVHEACPEPSATFRLSDPADSGPFMHAENRLAVMIYLDAGSAARPVPSLGALDGDPTLNVPEHIHETSAEVLWFQDGSGAMRVGDDTRPIRPGTFVYVPPNTIHGFEPDGTRPVFAYQVYTPSGPEQRFRTPNR
ncbi:MAG: cupin domain-containing protein [Polyangiales bacterium]